jgi:hypothetical protein
VWKGPVDPHISNIHHRPFIFLYYLWHSFPFNALMTNMAIFRRVTYTKNVCLEVTDPLHGDHMGNSMVFSLLWVGIPRVWLIVKLTDPASPKEHTDGRAGGGSQARSALVSWLRDMVWRQKPPCRTFHSFLTFKVGTITVSRSCVCGLL